MKIRTYLLLADDSNGKCLYRRIFSMVSTFIAPSSNRESKIQPPIRMISTSNFVRIWNAEKIYINDLGYFVISVFLSTRFNAKLPKNHTQSRCKSNRNMRRTRKILCKHFSMQTEENRVLALIRLHSFLLHLALITDGIRQVFRIWFDVETIIFSRKLLSFHFDIVFCSRKVNNLKLSLSFFHFWVVYFWFIRYGTHI